MPISPGTRIGPYEVVAPLGAGGMGEVYRARDSKLGRDVALKVLPAQLANNADYIARFQREAQVLASLNHSNIAGIYGLEENAIVMELVEGQTLAERIARGAIPILDALPIAGQIAEALDAAHEKGITHRDLKPANVKTTPEGIVKVLDFGLAKIMEPARTGNTSDSPTLTVLATEAGWILGTAGYMSPEQARGQGVDRRTDIWAFGALLYEMLAGRKAFEGETVTDLLAAVVKTEPDWSALPADTPPSIERLLRLCLTKDRRQRLQAMGDARIFFDIRADQAAHFVVAPQHFLPWALAGVLGIVTAIAFWAPWRTRPPEPDRPLVQLDLDVGEAVSQPAISPDGHRLVFVSKNQLALRRLDQSRITPLAGTAGASFPFFSPDGQWVAFFASGKLQKVAVDGGALVTLCDAPSGRGGTWDEDGNVIVALDSRGGLSRVSASGGTPQPLTDVRAAAQRVTSHRWPQALPSGKGVLFTASRAEGLVQVLLPGGVKSKTLVENASYARYVASGYLLYHQRGTVFAAQIDLDRMEVKGPATPLVNEVACDSLHGCSFDVSRSGTLVYRKGLAGANIIVSWLYASGKSEPLLTKPAEYWTPRLAADGKRLAVSVAQGGLRNLWVYDLNRETARRLTFESVSQDFPLWTPDGEFLAFESGGRLAWTRSDGSGTVEHLPTSGLNPAPTSFSPDGKWMVFHQEDRQTSWDLWLTPVERTSGGMRLGQLKPLLQQEGQQFGAAISGDGRWVAYASNESGRFEVYVMPFSPLGPARSGKWLISTEGGMWPAWSRRSAEIFFQDPDHRVMTASYETRGESFVPGKPRMWSGRRLAQFGYLSSFELGPDAKRLVALFDAEESKPETHLRVLLNVGDELRRRTGVK